MNLEIRLTPYMIYGLVTVKYTRLPAILLIIVGSTIDPSSSLLDFKPFISGVGAFSLTFVYNVGSFSLLRNPFWVR